MIFRAYIIAAVLFAIAILAPSDAQAQVVTFRLETTDLSGTPIDTVNVGDEFLLQTYTQHVGGYVGTPEEGGVFAGYLDVAYDETLASVAGDIVHGPLYQNGMNGDFAAGLLDNIGGFSSSGEQGIGMDPIGPGEQLLFSLLMKADEAGDLTFSSSESLVYPAYDVLVYGLNEAVPARDIDFGLAALRLDFGSATLNVQAVPEPSAFALLAIGFVFVMRRKRSIV